jgi:hypothetical protein
MALTFPISASIGQTYQSGSSNTYEWTGTYWKIKNITTRDFVGRTEYNIFSASINSVDKSFATTGSNHFYGDQTITGNLSANNFSADSSNVSLYANFSPNRIALETFNGANIILDTNQQGHIDITSPNVNVNGNINVSGSIIPTTAEGTYTSSFSLGSATNAWKDLYISHGSIIFVDAVTQETSSFSIDNNAGQNTVKYTAAVTASAYLGDGSGLYNLPSTTNWNKNKEYILRNTEQLTFSGDYILDNAYLLVEGSDEDVEYSPNKSFKKQGSIFIGGNLLLRNGEIENNGFISVGGEVILIGNSQIYGTGTII